MGYTIEVYIDKDITRNEIKDMMDTHIPDNLKGLFHCDEQEWGFVCDMDVEVKEGQVRNFIELHAAYGHDYRSFLLATINACLRSGYHIMNILYYM